MQVKEIMTKEVVFVHPETPVSDIARLLVEYGISGIPVVEHNQVVGIVTEEDLIVRDAIVDTPHVFTLFDSVFYLGSRGEFENEMHKILATRAGELMSAKVEVISEEATVQELATLMMKKNINPVPVIGLDSRLTGIVSRSDLIKLMVREQDADDLIQQTGSEAKTAPTNLPTQQNPTNEEV